MNRFIFLFACCLISQAVPVHAAELKAAADKPPAKAGGKTAEAAAEEKFSKAPFASPEDIVFLKKEDQELLDLQKPDSFIGIVRRLSVNKKELKTVELFQFKDIEKVKITEDLCKEVLAKIFGPLGEISLKLKKVEIIETERFGNSCEAVMTDPDTAATFTEQYIYVSSIHAQIYGLIFRFPKSAVKTDKEDMREFIQNLK